MMRPLGPAERGGREAEDRQELLRRARLARLRRDWPVLLRGVAAGEEAAAVAYARQLAVQRGAVASGRYRDSFYARASWAGGGRFRLVLGNSAPYAPFLEHGFRSHFVPGEGGGGGFRYRPGAATGMYVGPRGGFVPGRRIIGDAESWALATQSERVRRAFGRICAAYGVALGDLPG